MMWTERRRDKERVLQRREAIQKKEGKYDLLTLRPLALPLHPLSTLQPIPNAFSVLFENNFMAIQC